MNHSFIIVLFYFQFTLYSTLKGNKPDFHLSMNAETSEQFYLEFVQSMKNAYCEDKIKGMFFTF